jgi:uncharacterized protein (DUF488 family)
MAHDLYTIGHSATPLYTFLAALQKWKIKLLIDVRSRPSSRRFPHFDQANLEKSLGMGGVNYLFLGAQLGGRPDDPKAYAPDGTMDYVEWRKSPSFKSGIRRIRQELAGSDLTLMCAEEDPLECHRFLMISPALVELGIAPLHIRKGGVIETQQEAEHKLLKQQKLAAAGEGSLFSADRDSALQAAYLAQSRKCAFRREPSGQSSNKA